MAERKAQSYEGFRTDKGRLSEEPAAHLDFHRSALLGESVLGIHAFDKAHALMLGEQGIISGEVAGAMLAAFREMERSGVEAARAEADGGMHSGEHHLIKTLGSEVGGRLHLGRSSGDLIEVARRMTFRGHVFALSDSLIALRARLLSLAEDHLETVMPGYTHGQHAQPTTLAHWALMFEAVFARDIERISSFYSRLNRSPAGAAIMTGSDFPLDRARVSDLLGFDAPLSNTMDAILSHDLEMEYAGTLSLAAQNLARLAEDLFLWSTAEFAMIEIPDRFCGTSSIMPQKKNPDGLEDIKGLASQGMGLVATVTAAEKGPTGFPIMERRHTQDLLWRYGKALAVRVQTMTEIIANLEIDSVLMARRAGANWAQVTDLASALVRACGLDWRNAHQVVAVLVRRSIAQGKTPQDITTADLAEAAVAQGAEVAALDEATFRDALDPLAFVRRRGLPGGPAPAAVREGITTAARTLDDDRAVLAGRQAQVADSAARLEQEIDSFLSVSGSDRNG